MRTIKLSILIGVTVIVLPSIAAFYFGPSTDAQQQRTEVKIDPKLFDNYVGQYAMDADPDFIFSFLREGGKFFVQPVNQDRVEIFPESETKFFLKVADFQAT